MTQANSFAHLNRFVSDYIDSVELLQVLLLLQKDPEKQWTATSISEQLRSVPSSIQKRLNVLYGRGVLSGVAGASVHRFAPLTPEIDHIVEELSSFYQQRPHTVIDWIYAKPESAIRAFANAFKFKRRK